MKDQYIYKNIQLGWTANNVQQVQLSRSALIIYKSLKLDQANMLWHIPRIETQI